MKTKKRLSNNLVYFIAIILVALLSSCRTTKVSTKQEVETKVVTINDTSHLEIVTEIIDTAHVVHSETEKVRIEEYFDPNTGLLQRRVIDSERQIQSLLDQMTHMQHTIDSLQAHNAANVEIKEQDEETIKKPPVSIFNKLLIALSVLILFVFIVKVILPGILGGRR